jgi:hypothetical protein
MHNHQVEARTFAVAFKGVDVSMTGPSASFIYDASSVAALSELKPRENL